MTLGADAMLNDWLIRGGFALIVALAVWVWKMERRITQTETVMYGVSNSSSVVASLATVVKQLEEHGKLIQAVVIQVGAMQRDHDAELRRHPT